MFPFPDCSPCRRLLSGAWAASLSGIPPDTELETRRGTVKSGSRTVAWAQVLGNAFLGGFDVTRVEQHRVGNRMSAYWLLWVSVSVAPLLAYASPLWNNLLADTPIADLIWIPIIALGWALWNILSDNNSPEPDDGELNFILGTMLAVMTGAALILAPERWPILFVHDHGGLLLWPFWILAMTWLFWGLSATRAVLAPLTYLFLVWPPIFEAVANATQNVLVHWAVGSLVLFSHDVQWLVPSLPVGTFSVLYHNHPVLVVVAQACSGADSLLGSAIVIPVLWFAFKGRLISKMWISLLALLGSLIINWVRLAIIVLAVHLIGPGITFSDIHPILGFLLFALLVAGLMLLSRPLGLGIPPLSLDPHIKKPGWGRISSAAVLAGIIVILLWPLFSLPEGSFGNPSTVPVFNPRTFLPPLPGFAKNPVYYANESSVLGPGAATQADMYFISAGTGQALVEMWSTPSAAKLATYGFHACLLYHGDTLKAVKSFQLVPGVIATAYSVQLPPNYVGGPRSTYVDVEWNDAVSVHGQIRYMRWSIAAFPHNAPLLPPGFRSPGSLKPLSVVQSMVAPSSQGHWDSWIVKTRTTLVAMAGTIFRNSLENPGPR